MSQGFRVVNRTTIEVEATVKAIAERFSSLPFPENTRVVSIEVDLQDDFVNIKDTLHVTLEWDVAASG